MSELTKEGEVQTQEQEEEEVSIEVLSKGVEILKNDFKSIDRQTVMLGLMVLAVCIVFFFLGYYFGTHHATIECNKVILENQMMGTVAPTGLWG